MTTTALTFLTGDATRPATPGMKIIAHCCNDVGAWGAGFVLALSKRWRAPRQRYSESFGMIPLGGVQYVEVETDIIVANIIGQHGVGLDDNGVAPIRYAAISSGFQSIANLAKSLNASVHMPRIGCGLAGGDWAIIEELIKITLSDEGVQVYVYDLPGQPFKGGIK